jgi:hypothetical protein
MSEHTNKHNQEAACGQAAQRPSTAAVGASPSNTAPLNSETGGYVKIIRSGIDSLYLSYPGQLSSEAGIRLETLKKLAQSDNPKTAALAQFDANGHLFEVSDRARGVFAYVLRDNWYQLSIASHKAGQLPLATAQISSELLTLQGSRAAESRLRSVVESLGQIEGIANISRLDICVDFVTDYPLNLIRDEDWITRAKIIDRYTVNREFSGFMIGAGGVLSARLYNKTLELEKSGKYFFEDVWKRFGWQPGETVWRLEFQFRRGILKELGITTFDQLDEALGSLWAYATQSWLRLTDPDSHLKKRADLPTHPLWEALRIADWLDAEPCVREPVQLGRLPSDERLYVNGLSGITAHMARESIFDPEEGYRDFWRCARAYHNDRAEMTGLLFADYLIEKARTKARQYNTTNNRDALDGPDPVTQAVARAYKKRRDG